MASKGNILIGISGGIAAYKSLSLIRLFVKHGYNVKVVTTPNALQFVTPLSIETLSKNKLYADVFHSPEEYSTQHISIAEFADVFVVAPATANVIGKFASGIADDALSTTFLATKKPVFIAPAMNDKMYHHAVVQNNIQSLKNLGVHFINPGSGDLACGYHAEGRMEEPEAIFNHVVDFLNQPLSFKNKKVLVTAGPTVEPIDPVRYISNHSSGKMGVEIAHQFAQKGAEVTLVCGPSSIQSSSAIHRINVTTASDMLKACNEIHPQVDILVMAAAVADYTPAVVEKNKIKKESQSLSIELSKTTDILLALAEKKQSHQLHVGFALETDNEVENALDKLSRKKLDMIVLNSLKDQGAGFGGDTNKITVIDKHLNSTTFDLKSKKDVASDIVNCIEKYLKLSL